MTCIVGLINKGKVYIGGDSAGVSGYSLAHRADEKVFKKDNMIFGFTSSFRMGQILRYSLKIPDHDPRISDDEYMCTTFVDSIIECFKTKGYATISNNEISGGVFIVGYNENLYMIESDFQVGKQLGRFAACGCGEDYALGALSILENMKLTPEEKVTKALEVATHWSAGVIGPYNIVSI